MLDPIYLWYVADKIVDIWDELNEWAIKDIAERIMEAELYKYDKLPGTARWRAWLLQQSGMHYDEMLTRISKLTNKSEEAVRQLFVEAGLMSVDNDAQIYEKHNIEVPDIRQDKQLTQILESTYKQTNGEMRNYTRTTLDSSNKLMIDTLDKAYFDIKSGNRSYSEAIKEAIDTVSKQGLTVTYPSGHRDTIETAVRRAVMTGLNQGTAKVSLANCEKLGAEYVVISAHEGARVSDDPVANHLGWQGKIFKLKGSTRKYKNLKEATGFPDNPLGLCGYNCRHNLYPHFLGDSNPWEDIANKAQENKESYETAQKQRQMERAIRKSKRELLGYQTGIDNCEDEKTKFELQMEHDRLANRLQSQNKAYNKFCKENNLVKESDRLRIAGWDRSTADKVRSGAGRYNKPKNTNKNTELISIPILYNKTIFYDETKKWFKEATPNSHKVIDLTEYTVDGNTYKVDGRHVILRYSKNEKRVADVLEKMLGGELFMVPKIDYPTNISTPDYLFRNEKYDLKTLRGTSKNAIYNRLIHMKKQADNFVLDVTDFNFSYEDIEKQIGYVYWSKHTRFVNKIILVKGDIIVKIYSRDK